MQDPAACSGSVCCVTGAHHATLLMLCCHLVSFSMVPDLCCIMANLAVIHLHCPGLIIGAYAAHHIYYNDSEPPHCQRNYCSVLLLQTLPVGPAAHNH